jgi:hypothetical protein
VADPTYTPEPADRALVVRALAAEDVHWGYDHGFAANDGESAAFADAVLAALEAKWRAEGRLLPADAETRTEPMSFGYVDDVVEIQLRAHSYPYGNGQLGAGVQITLDDGRGIIRAVRLPAGPACDLALAMLAAVDPWLPVPAAETHPVEG